MLYKNTTLYLSMDKFLFKPEIDISMSVIQLNYYTTLLSVKIFSFKVSIESFFYK